ncbi:MAG TPA: hypothetical protein VMU27_03285 [Candidatus Paceibacterota bacterium]|nr:hypothetical protein [Candidatus Paceibacterota bacterium]
MASEHGEHGHEKKGEKWLDKALKLVMPLTLGITVAALAPALFTCWAANFGFQLPQYMAYTLGGATGASVAYGVHSKSYAKKAAGGHSKHGAH